MRLTRGRLALLALLALVSALVVVLLVVRPLGDTRFGSAVAALPPETLRVSFTDWERVAEEADGGSVTAATPTEDVDAFLDRAYARDLLTQSPLATSFPGLAANFGITPLDATWEVYGQGRGGAVDVLRLRDSTDLGKVESRLRRLGYDAPADDGPQIWSTTVDTVAAFDVPLTLLETNVGFAPDRSLLVFSDAPEAVDAVLTVVSGSLEGLDSVAGVEALVDTAGDPTVAALWARDHACEDLAMVDADPADREAAAALVREAGGVHPVAGLVMAQDADLTLRVGLAFESDEQASEDLQARVDLASGEAPGQGGTFAERFSVTSGTADGRLVTLVLDPVEGPLLGDLGQGPLLFATC